ncbi:hypothetical protein PPNSA23_28410 [Phyllobacterium phragmitis]|uniref:Uncharacterized protein n=1 Tax=Phyllobacterium phragmitis TaxID=2670329 RepID=A0ABQ0H1X0_9HYPH
MTIIWHDNPQPRGAYFRSDQILSLKEGADEFIFHLCNLVGFKYERPSSTKGWTNANDTSRLL